MQHPAASGLSTSLLMTWIFLMGTCIGWFMVKKGCLCSVQVAFYAATALVGGYAWASSSGFAPTGRQVIDGFLGDVQALFNNKTFLSGLLALLSVAAVAVGSLILNQPLTYFHPSDFR